MAKPKTRYWRSLFLVGVMVAAIWGVVGVQGYSPQLGLDLQGGISVALTPVEGAEFSPDSLDKAVDIIRERVDAFGVAEPDIARQGDSVIVQIAGVKAEEQDRAFELIGSTAKLRFRPVLETLPPIDQVGEGNPSSGDVICGDPSTYPTDQPDQPLVACLETPGVPAESWTRLRLGPVAVDGEQVSSAQAAIDVQGVSGWYVTLDLTGEGAAAFKDITGQLACNRGQPPRDQLAIVLDGVVRSAPQMGEGVECNRGISQAQITGNFSEEEAKDLALILRYGALPVELEPSSTTTVSPTLGRESLRNGLIASAIGVAVVFLYVLLFYRFLGLVIWLGIAIHAAITLGLIILLGQVAGFSLSLAGIAGLIVSLGIATDSFIVYFERVKDEVKDGKPVRLAVERAWDSAKRTIIAADLVTALAALVLYMLAVGGVRGFALMLGLSTTLDLLVSFLFMHPIVYLLGQTKLLRNAKSLAAGVTTEGRA
jgi:preprotein translocase subunit SecD